MTVLLADSEEAIVDKVEGIWQKAQLILNASDVYKRIEQLPDNVESVTEMFASFGDLFANGTLGSCREVPRKSGEPCPIILYGNASRELKEKAVYVLKALERLAGTAPFAAAFPGSKNDTDLRKITIDAEDMFRKTWECYYYFKEDVANALLSGLNKKLLELNSWCQGWIAEYPAQWDYILSTEFRYVHNDMSINRALREIGPNCSFYDEERKAYEVYAHLHRLIGRESNRCLQNFVVRSSQYEEKAFKSFLSEMHTYLFQDLALYGIWLSWTQANATERIRRKSWVRENVAVLSKQLLAARELFKEAPTDAPFVDGQNPLSPTSLTVDEVDSIVATVMTTHGSDIDPLPWKDRPSRYNGLINKIVNDIKREHSNFSSEGSIEGVMYLPHANDAHLVYCVLKLHENENQTSFYEKQDYKGASIFIKWTIRPYPSGFLSARMDFIHSHETDVWDAIFGKKTDDVCKNARIAASDPKLIGFKDASDRSEFTAVVAIRCAYEFVWYELGWRYYEAAATTSEYVLSRHAGEYNDACGQLIFFP